MSKPVILTGLRANNDLTLGNYIGAMLPMVQLQNKYAGEYQINMFVPDLHSFTTPIDHSELYIQTIHNLKLFVAAGLDINNPDTFIYRQSYIPAHSELTVILNCFTYMGELNRMTQFKEKGKIGANISAGLFDYPVLMAADILLYGAKYVPVGEDQTQHVELARDIAIRFNNKFGDVFELPEPEKAQIAFTNQQERLRIRDLVKPEQKMSKSDQSGKGVIFLSDTPEFVKKKIMGATTDSIGEIHFNMKTQPGVSNLMVILSSLSGEPLDKIISQYEGQKQYGSLKSDVADVVVKFLNEFQNTVNNTDEKLLMSKLDAGEKSMNQQASTVLLTAQRAVGLRK